MTKWTFAALAVGVILWSAFCAMGSAFAIPGDPDPDQKRYIALVWKFFIPIFLMGIPGSVVGSAVAFYRGSPRAGWCLLATAVFLPVAYLAAALRALPLK